MATFRTKVGATAVASFTVLLAGAGLLATAGAAAGAEKQDRLKFPDAGGLVPADRLADWRPGVMVACPAASPPTAPT